MTVGVQGVANVGACAGKHDAVFLGDGLQVLEVAHIFEVALH